MSSRAPGGWRFFESRHRRNARRRILYLPGGAFIRSISASHWSLIHEVTALAASDVLVAAYPLIPAAHPRAIVERLAGLVAALGQDAGPPLVIMGDSAGANLALAATQLLSRAGRPLPASLVCISPWLDLRVGHPRQRELEIGAAPLTIAGFRRCGELYAGSLGIGHPMASSLFGPMAGLPPLTILTGDVDLLSPDSRRLAAKLTSAGTEFEYVESPGAPHNYPLLDDVRASVARRHLAAVVCQ